MLLRDKSRKVVSMEASGEVRKAEVKRLLGLQSIRGEDGAAAFTEAEALGNQR